MELVTIVSLAKGYSPLFSLYGTKCWKFCSLFLSLHSQTRSLEPTPTVVSARMGQGKAFTTTSSSKIISVFV